MINEFKKISKTQNCIIFDIAFALKYLEEINHHTETQELKNIIPDFLIKKIDILGIFYLLQRKNTFTEKNWNEIINFYKITDDYIKNYNNFLEKGNCSCSNNITITTEDMYQYNTAKCAANTIVITSEYNITKEELTEMFDIIKNKLKVIYNL